MEELQSKEVAVRRKDDGELRRARGGHVSLAGVGVFKTGGETEGAGCERAKGNRCKQAAACETQANISKTCRANERGKKKYLSAATFAQTVGFPPLIRRIFFLLVLYFPSISICLFCLLIMVITFFLSVFRHKFEGLWFQRKSQIIHTYRPRQRAKI